MPTFRCSPDCRRRRFSATSAFIAVPTRPASRWGGTTWQRWLIPLICIAAAPLAALAQSQPTPEQLEFFESRVRPLLADHCYSCHSVQGDKLQAGLRVDHRQGLIQGGDSGPAIVPGKPDESLLMEAVRYESYEMPPQGKLPEANIEILERWVAMGAPWPDEPEPQAGESSEAFDLQTRRSEHWAWQAITDPDPPAVTVTSWPRNELDHFILAKLESAGLSPSPATDQHTLVRRLFFDLIGLPPSRKQLAELQQFIESDQASQDEAIENLVDGLLQSPHFGERWGRHWLDLVRYAESRGHEFDEDAVNAHQYRDYVIRAFNADIPYDEFVREQIAGDLLAEPRLHPEQGFNESVLGTGFWFLGEWVHSPVDVRKDEAERFDNMIDVMSKTFLGVTVACARCHDHKFDAISAADYYALSGFLQSSDYRQVRFESQPHNRDVAKRLAALDREFAAKLRPAIAEGLTSWAKRQASNAFANETFTSKPMTAKSSPADAADNVVVDYADVAAEDYLQDGVIYGVAPRRPGDFIPPGGSGQAALELAPFAAAVNDPFWHGLTSESEPATNLRGKLESLPRSGRTLRTPTFELKHHVVHCQLRGSGHIVACVDSHRLVAGPLHGETVVHVKPMEPEQVRWVKLNLSRYVGHRLHLEITPDEGQTLQVLRVVEGAIPEQLRLASEFVDSGSNSVDPTQLLEAINVWSRGELAEHPQAVSLVAALRWAMLQDDAWQEAPVEAGHRVADVIAHWRQQREELSAERKLHSRLAMAMIDGGGENDHLLIRGNPAHPGREIPRRFLAAIDGDQPLDIKRGSGRLELAARINDPSNPLTSRVIVNRVWHHLMGRGIVATTDDFGVLGQRPTHPELLDHLATWFDRNGRSLKGLIRYIVTSASYRMSSQLDPAAQQQDPKNLLWHHVPPKRLEGEAIRDALLTVAGTLDRSLYGPSVPIHLTSFMDGRGRPSKSGPLDGDLRRSIYVAVRRNFLSPFMLAFDTPVPFSTMGRRNVSNVPAQALILMNDPFVAQCAQHFGERVMAEAPGQAESRIEWMYQTAFARSPTPQESEAILRFIDEQTDETQSWTDVAHALINTKEFIYVP